MDWAFELSLVRLVSEACFAGASLGCCYAVVTSVLVLRFGLRRNKRPGSDLSQPPVTILKPLNGDEPGLLPRLAVFCTQDYAAPVQVVFGSQDPADPAIDVVKQLQTALPEKTIELKIDGRAHGCNRKISNLTNMAALARHDVLVLSDADMEVDPDYLSETVAELQRPGVTAVTYLYHGIAAFGIWSRLSALEINTHFLPNVIAAVSLGLARPCFGSTIAMRRETLNRVGGFEVFADCLADDYAIGVSVRSTSYEVAIPSFSIGHVCDEGSFRELLMHQLRAARTIKTLDPLGYAGALITHPFPLALIAVLLAEDHPLSILAVALACRTALCISVERAFGLGPQQYWLIPVQDLMAFAVHVWSFFGTSVSWKGQRYRITADGSLVEDALDPEHAWARSPGGGWGRRWSRLRRAATNPQGQG